MTRFFLAAVRKDRMSGDVKGETIELIWNFGQFLGDLIISLDKTKGMKWGTYLKRPLGEPPRYVFAIKGYTNSWHAFEPDVELLKVARAKLAGIDVADNCLIGRINFLRKLSFETNKGLTLEYYSDAPPIPKEVLKKLRSVAQLHTEELSRKHGTTVVLSGAEIVTPTSVKFGYDGLWWLMDGRASDALGGTPMVEVDFDGAVIATASATEGPEQSP